MRNCLRPSRILSIGILLLAGAVVRPLAAQTPPTGGISGTVWDSTRATPLAGAEVFLVGTTVTATTNPDGGFLIPGLAAGHYAIAFRHPRIELLGWVPDAVTIEVQAGATANITLAVPARPEPRQVPMRSAAPPPAPAGSPSVIVGTVVDATSGRGIAGASVHVRDTPIGIVTDERGRFLLFNVPPGARFVDVQMLGYADRATSLTAARGTTLEVRIPLSTEAIELDPVVVEVRSEALERSGFYARMEDGGIHGSFITPVEIERRAPAMLTDLFTEVPGVRVDYRQPGQRSVTFRRIVGSDTTADGCKPDLYLDGMRIRGNWDFIAPNVIDGIEVYVGANVPIEYASNACGVVLVWTRRGR